MGGGILMVHWYCETRGLLANHNYPNRAGFDLSEIDNPVSYIANTPEQNKKVTKIVSKAIWEPYP